jgi:hypothetical protein
MKIQDRGNGQGYILTKDDGQVLIVPREPSNRHYVEISALIEGGHEVLSPPAPPDTTPGDLSGEAQRRIVGMFAAETPSDQFQRQLESATRLTLLDRQERLQGVNPQEKDELLGLCALWSRVHAIRAHAEALKSAHSEGETVDVSTGSSSSIQAGWPA